MRYERVIKKLMMMVIFLFERRTGLRIIIGHQAEED
jgi:hypothetical protein